MGKLIGYARVSTRAQDTDRQIADLLAAGVRRDGLYSSLDWLHGTLHGPGPQERRQDGNESCVPRRTRSGGTGSTQAGHGHDAAAHR
jgi:hypothetical protein